MFSSCLVLPGNGRQASLRRTIASPAEESGGSCCVIFSRNCMTDGRTFTRVLSELSLQAHRVSDSFFSSSGR
ncbi:hypothetical protein DPEC_G00098390 [Dallia pectoralis]|uniref:Uncharacterized protein n=1 Tax=Dallia pectoralis TaxID=75939 RepID=A0ACC2GWG4_DALPE|nr:hypothetical protein DPEC_G00098390 [Dallia pectoralis]